MNDTEIAISYVSSGTRHKYEFGYCEGNAWPEYFVQGGETYRASLDEIPDWVTEVVKTIFGLAVNRR
jgi:hypothetical protein